MAKAGTPSGQRHKGLVKLLVVLGSLVAVIACFSTWAERQALSTDDWVNTSGRLIQNPEIRNAVSNYAVDQLYANVNVSAELQKVLPSTFKQLSGPASTGLRSVAVDGVERALTTSRFQQLWRNANRAAHQTLINIIENKSSAVSTNNGEVVLKLQPLLTQAGAELGLPTGILDKLPPDAGNLKILKSDQLSLAQTIAKLIRGLALVSSLLALALFALAIYLSRDYRWITVLGVGIALILVGVVVLILREVVGNVLVQDLATQDARPAADATWAIGTSLLSSIAKQIIVFGVFFVIAAWLASPHRSAVATRRVLTPILRDHPVVVVALLGIIALIWVLSAVDSTRAIVTRLVLVAMAAVGVYQLRRRCVADFPDATLGDVPGRMRVRATSLWRGRHRARPESQDRKLERLERLTSLHERGALSDEEFAAEKAAVMASGEGEGEA